MHFVFLLLFVSFFGQATAIDTYDPIALYLTWQNDPTTTMSIRWVSLPDEAVSAIKYRCPKKSKTWQTVSSSSANLPHKHPYLLHRAELKNLEPDTEYHFKLSENGHNYKFKTLPKALNAPLRFVVGGDIFHDSIESLRETNIQAAKTSPSFALQGGDLGYSSKKVDPWITWLTVWKETMITPEGYLIPMIATLGNHDTEGHYGDNPEHAPIFSAFFRGPNQTSYCTIDAGDYFALTVLDSGHTNAIDGKQAKWLGEVLKKRAHFTHKFALYHIPAYPSVKKFDSKRGPIIRAHWVPLFEKYGLHAAFEHHDHCYKRSIRLKEGQEDSKGVLYLGDGAWGVTHARLPKTKPEQTWYLAKTAPIRHFILVTLEKNKRTFEAIDFTGERFDVYSTKN